MIIFLILSIVLGGLLIGALGRLALPGPDPMGIGTTILVGIGGAFIGGIGGRLIWGPHLRAGRGGGIFVLEVLGATLIVYLIRRSQGRTL